MPPRKVWAIFVLVLIANYFISNLLFPAADAPITIPYTVFRDQAGRGNVAAIYSRNTSIEGRFKSAVTWPPPGEAHPPAARAQRSLPSRTATTFTTELPAFFDRDLEGFLIRNGVEISAVPIQQGSGWATLLFGFGPALLIIAFYVWMYRRAAHYIYTFKIKKAN